MEHDLIVIRGAKEHNLKNIDVTLPRFKFVVITGVSGSGKSSLAFDTIYAEGQRRYVESLSAYARQFIGQMEKPKVDYIGGLSPAIAIEQKAVSKNPRSTVATVTEIYDYLRVLYARVGTPHCPECGRQVSAQSAQEIVDRAPRDTCGRSVPGAGANGPQSQRHVCRRARAGPGRWLLPGTHRRARRRAEQHTQAGQVVPAHDRPGHRPVGRSRPPQSPTMTSMSLASPIRWRTALGVADGMVIIDRGEGDEWLMSEHNSCPDCAHLVSQAGPRDVLVQLAAGHVPHLQRPGNQGRVRS